jgi:uncharacterized protein
MKTILVPLLSLIALAAVAQESHLPLSDFPRSALRIATPDARLHPFKIWVARDEVHREQGLMFVKNLPADAGMLFVYSAPQRIGIWMKNTLIPLDILFIRADGRIAKIAANAKPLSLDVMEENDVVAVLELNGGAAEKMNIHKGAIVMHPFFGNTGETKTTP